MKLNKLFIPLFLLAFFSCDPKPNPSPEDSNLPHFQLTMDADVDEINKENFIEITLTLDGGEFYEDFEGTGGIRGRGNSSWNLPKKPYRIKLDEKNSLLGLAPYKDWILLADYLDGSMLYNAVPFKAAEILGIPYTNHVIPVDVSFNNEYHGLYTFMEHKEVGPNRIDIGENGLLLELDNDMDEDWQFRSDKYNLPVMISYPKSKDINQGLFEEIKQDFENFEALVYADDFPNNNYLDYFDAQAYVDYMIVYQLTLNTEINLPRSTYINKLEGGKYRMGIIWDFDFGFGFSFDLDTHYKMSTATKPLFWNSDEPGTLFFSRFMEDPQIKSLFKERWNWFRSNGFEQVKDNVRQHSEMIKHSVPKDHKLWGTRGSTTDSKKDLEKILNWLDARADYLDSYVNEL